MNFISVSSDLGGFRHGFESAGWSCIRSLQWESLFGRNSLSSCDEVEVAAPTDGRTCDAIAVELPASERVSGSWDEEGNWRGLSAVSKLLRTIATLWTPQLIVVLGRRTVLSERFGASFAELLLQLNSGGYSVVWISVNLSWIGIPQDSRRVVVLAYREESITSAAARRDLMTRVGTRLLDGSVQSTPLGNWSSTIELLGARMPRIGLKAPTGANPFGNWGLASGGVFSSGAFRFVGSSKISPTLRTVFLGDEPSVDAPPVSVRFVSRGGQKGLQIKEGSVAHSVGPSVSAWPLFALPLGWKQVIADRMDLVNWHRTAYGYDVFRLTPNRALLLFGQEAAPLGSGLGGLKGSVSDAYRIVSATTPPRLAERIANVVS